MIMGKNVYKIFCSYNSFNPPMRVIASKSSGLLHFWAKIPYMDIF